MVDFRKQVTEQQMLFHLVYVKYFLYIHTVMSWRMFNKMLSGSISNDYFCFTYIYVKMKDYPTILTVKANGNYKIS